MTGIITSARRLTSLIAMSALMLMAVVTFIDVAGRVLFSEPLGFAYELVGVLLGIAAYAGLFQAQVHRGHIAIDLLDGRFRRWPTVDRWRFALVWMVELTFWLLIAACVTRQAATSMGYGETFLFLPVARQVPLFAVAGLAWVAVSGHLAAGALPIRGRTVEPGEQPAVVEHAA